MPKYEILTANTYLDGVQAIKILGEQGELDQKYHQDEKRDWRPLSLKETIQVIVEAYDANDISLLKLPISSVSAIAYETYYTEDSFAYHMKIIPVSKELLNPKDTESGKIKISNYSSLKAKEIDGGIYFYSTSKLQERMKNCWLETLGRDKILLDKYAKIVSVELGLDIEQIYKDYLRFLPDDRTDFVNKTISPLSKISLEDGAGITGLTPLNWESNFIVVYKEIDFCPV